MQSFAKTISHDEFSAAFLSRVPFNPSDFADHLTTNLRDIGAFIDVFDLHYPAHRQFLDPLCFFDASNLMATS